MYLLKQNDDGIKKKQRKRVNRSLKLRGIAATITVETIPLKKKKKPADCNPRLSPYSQRSQAPVGFVETLM